MAESERIAVGIGARDTRRAGGAAGTGDVFDQELLPECTRELVSDDAAGDVSRPAGGERHHDRDRAHGIILRLRAGNAGQRNQHDRSDWNFHRRLIPKPTPQSAVCRCTQPVAKARTACNS
jgi:hypothetical protein